MSTEKLTRTGWFTFFIIFGAVLPLISNVLQVLSGIQSLISPPKVGNFEGAEFLQASSASSNAISIIFSIVMSAIFFYFSLWLFKARTSLRELNEDNQEDNTLIAQSNLLKFAKVSTIIEIVSIVFLVFVVVAIMGSVALFGNLLKV